MQKKKMVEVTSQHRRRQLDPDDILYMISRDRKSHIYLADGKVCSTNASIRQIAQQLDPAVFETINKGVLISLAHLSSVDGLDYRMDDGRVLRARIKTSNRRQWSMRVQTTENKSRPATAFYAECGNVQAFALLAPVTGGVRVVFSNETWQIRFGIQDVFAAAFGEEAPRALATMHEAISLGGVSTIQAGKVHASFFRVDNCLCTCLIRDVE